jgi:small subunit ribosomal protein S4
VRLLLLYAAQCAGALVGCEESMKYTGPKAKLSRSLGIALTPKAARIMERRPGPPGQHGGVQRGRPQRMSDYKRQLMEKQRLRAQYNIHERQMRNYFRKAARRKGTTPENLIYALESRLDAVVLRGGLAPTIYAARQLVSHGHIQVNGKRVTYPAYVIRPGDVVSIKPSSRNIPMVVEAVDSATPPPYLELAKDDMAVTLRYLPQREEVPVICDLALVVEFYSR